MGQAVEIVVICPSAADLHRFRNFGEDLWRAFRDDDRVSLDIDEVDRAITHFTVKVHAWSKDIVRKIERMLVKHRLDGMQIEERRPRIPRAI